MSHETRNNKTDGQATATIQCFIQPRRDGGVPRCVKAVLIWFTNCISWLAAARLQFPSLNFYDPKASPVPIHAGCNTDTALGWGWSSPPAVTVSKWQKPSCMTQPMVVSSAKMRQVFVCGLGLAARPLGFIARASARTQFRTVRTHTDTLADNTTIRGRNTVSELHRHRLTGQ